MKKDAALGCPTAYSLAAASAPARKAAQDFNFGPPLTQAVILRSRARRERRADGVFNSFRPYHHPPLPFNNTSFMPSKKRRRSPRGNDRSSDAAKREPRERPLSLELYRILPAEIRQLVIDFACRASSSSDYLFTTDVTTAWSLSLASRELNERARPSLYRDLVINRPSALYALHRTLEAHPERAKLTRRLHIGPLNALPKGWWPLTSAYAEGEGWSSAAGQHLGSPSTWLKTSLKESDLPSGYGSGHAWNLRQALPGCREAAVSHAIQVAQDYLGFDAHLEGLDSSTTKIAAILEVQAALDWALERVRNMEEEDSTLQRLAQPGARVPVQCRSGNCKHYLSLNILDALQQRASSRRGWSLGGQRCQSCMALLRHLARPGALTDRFDHPLVFVRSAFMVMVMPALGHGHEDRDRRCDTLIMMDSPFVVDKKYEWPDLAALHEDSREWERELCGDVPNGNAKRAQAVIDRNDMIIQTSSLARTLSLARSVVALMPNLEDVSLTGYLQVLFSRTKDAARLRQASFGPPPCFWDARLPLSGFDGLEKLHLCGVVIFKDEVLRITNDMPRLRVFQWTMAEEYPDWIRENVKYVLRGNSSRRTGPSDYTPLTAHCMSAFAILSAYFSLAKPEQNQLRKRAMEKAIQTT